MDKETVLLKKHLLDLANQSYQNNMFTFTGFLSVHEQQLLTEVQKEQIISKETGSVAVAGFSELFEKVKKINSGKDQEPKEK